MTKWIFWAVGLTVAVTALATPSIATAQDYVLRPLLPTDKVIVMLHGSGGNAKDLVETPSSDTWLRHGFAVAGSDAGGGQTWGNPESVADNVRMIDRLGYERVFLFGSSMGGLDTMRLIGLVHPEAVAAISPVCDITHLIPTMSPAVEEAWGESRPSYLSPVVPRPEPGLPVDIWASPEDTWVPKRWNADVCARELRHRGADVREVSIHGEHWDPKMSGTAVFDFFMDISSRRPEANPPDTRASTSGEARP
jgi:pimeloyl-ACP methyl ester carboxylesterase